MMAQQKPSWFANGVVIQRGLWLLVAAVSSFWYPQTAVHGSSALLLPPAQSQQVTKEATALEAGIKLERELAAGEKHAYQVALSAGQYARVTVEQRGTDVVVRWLSPDGKQLAESDFEGRLQKEETAEIVAEKGGIYRLVIEARDPKARGGYAVALGELRVATEDDRSLNKARDLYAESVQLFRAGKHVEGLTPGQQALEIREKILGPDHYLVAASLNVLGNLQSSRGDLVKAESLYGRALEIREKALGPDHPDVGSTLNNIAGLNRQKGDYVRAEVQYRRALEIKEKALGPDHLDVSASLTNLGVLYNGKSQFDKAEPLLQRALEIRERLLGDHRDVATSLTYLGYAQRGRRDLVKAEASFQRALQIREKFLGPNNVAVAFALINLGSVQRMKGDFTKAELTYERALKIREDAVGKADPSVADALTQLANLYYEMTNYAKAGPLYERALEINEKALGPAHHDLAVSLSSVARIYQVRGDSTSAEPLFRRALEMREKLLGSEHLDVANSLNELAALYNARSDFAKAESLYLRALEIREKVWGPEHPFFAAALNSLAGVYAGRGNYEKAKTLIERSLEIRQKVLKPEHSDIIAGWVSLGQIFHVKGDFPKAEALLQRALEAKEKALDLEHRDLVYILGQLGSLYRSTGDLVKAEPLFLRALKISEKAYGPDHLVVATSLSRLGALYYNKGEYSRAEPFYLRAVDIMQKVLGPEHRDVASALDDLAMVYRHGGEPAKAEALIQRVLEIRERTLGPEHSAVAKSYACLAIFFAANGDYQRAVRAQSRADAINERNIAFELLTGSERDKLAYLALRTHSIDQTVSLNSGVTADDSDARELAATTILRQKGRVLDTLYDTLAALRHRFNSEDQILLNRLKDTTSQLGRLVLNGPQTMDPAEHRKQIRNLEDQRDKLESDISRRSAGFYELARPVTIAAIQAVVPANAALVEFAVYRPFDPKPRQSESSYGPARYVSYVVRSGGEVQRRELGEAAAIDKLIDDLRKALRDPKRKDVQQLARAVDEKVTQPVRSLVGDANQLLISADGALNLIPFEALVDERGNYLIERYSISYLTSGRDLLRMQVARASKTEAVVIANPQFGESEIALAGREQARKPKPFVGKRQSVTAARDLSSVYFAPLDATALEARAIKSLFTGAAVFTGSEASESALKRVDAPRILHIATHGFFLQDASDTAADVVAEEGIAGTRAINARVKVENPLLRSGLALAGANSKNAGSDDGILTALEASSLNLWGTKLVTLSACDTGIGEVKNGEGVYGLRRAVVLAGAETLVMSMWPVSDYVTRDMMTAYYQGLKQGQGRGEALRQVKLNMLKRQDRRHPFYWASFIQSGEWANLEGKR